MLGQSQWEQGAENAYDAIAPYYDEFTAHHDYEDWVAKMLAKLEANGLSGDRLLDVACGTGKSLLPMLQRGWKVTGCDVSAEMVAIARSKVGNEADLRVADVRELPAIGEFDLVFAVGDLVNYLLDQEGLVAAFKSIKRNLAPGGRLVFDANTLHTFRTFFAEEVVVEREGHQLVWHGLTEPGAEPGVTAEATFEVVPDDPALPRVGPDLHRERHFSRPELEAALEAAGLRALAVYGHEADGIMHQPPDEGQDVKSLYIAAAA
jgi:SAM-dependent methyltransferase